MHIQHYFSDPVSTYTEGAMKQREGLSGESNAHMNNVEAGKRPSWNTAHFVADTITANVALDGIRRVWGSRHNDTRVHSHTHPHPQNTPQCRSSHVCESDR